VTLVVFQPIKTLLASSVYFEMFSGVVVSPGSTKVLKQTAAVSQFLFKKKHTTNAIMNC
jgi:hypothetical protein